MSFNPIRENNILTKNFRICCKQIRKFYRFLGKVIFKKKKNYKIWAMDLSSDYFIQNFFWPDTLAILAKKAKETGSLPHCLVKRMPGHLDRD